jgi:hypothetical protein
MCYTAKTAQRSHSQNEVDKKAGAERDKQKDADTTELPICHSGLKLAENRPRHKRFSLRNEQVDRWFNWYAKSFNHKRVRLRINMDTAKAAESWPRIC